MVIRIVERCPVCGKVDPWRKGKKGYSRIVKGERMAKVFCKSCGHPEVVVYREKQK